MDTALKNQLFLTYNFAIITSKIPSLLKSLKCTLSPLSLFSHPLLEILHGHFFKIKLLLMILSYFITKQGRRERSNMNPTFQQLPPSLIRIKKVNFVVNKNSSNQNHLPMYIFKIYLSEQSFIKTHNSAQLLGRNSSLQYAFFCE